MGQNSQHTETAKSNLEHVMILRGYLSAVYKSGSRSHLCEAQKYNVNGIQEIPQSTVNFVCNLSHTCPPGKHKGMYFCIFLYTEL